MSAFKLMSTEIVLSQVQTKEMRNKKSSEQHLAAGNHLQYFRDMSSSSSKFIQESNEILPFEMKHLPDFALKKLKDELKETPEKRRKSILELKKMLDGMTL
ncbi:hypothetical protein NPIL_605931 [Nephila pilipes]|uniref:Uncharacterized protein n=1 Tax=Nephila pilipes TaxID=299642 RepID=A0A8X6I943_NEPPI|nr:hypothetical protein NPIL_250961 [Nephila pilipes]GFU08506.1 hypothetical protein NPIL_605931 [Nephila pilipes]